LATNVTLTKLSRKTLGSASCMTGSSLALEAYQRGRITSQVEHIVTAGEIEAGRVEYIVDGRDGRVACVARVACLPAQSETIPTGRTAQLPGSPSRPGRFAFDPLIVSVSSPTISWPRWLSHLAQLGLGILVRARNPRIQDGRLHRQR
jgi:hypothetical protein